MLSSLVSSCTLSCKLIVERFTGQSGAEQLADQYWPCKITSEVILQVGTPMANFSWDTDGIRCVSFFSVTRPMTCTSSVIVEWICLLIRPAEGCSMCGRSSYGPSCAFPDRFLVRRELQLPLICKSLVMSCCDPCKSHTRRITRKHRGLWNALH